MRPLSGCHRKFTSVRETCGRRSHLRTVSILALVVSTGLLCPAQTAPDPAHAPLLLTAPVADKNFYVLSLLARDSEAVKALSGDAALSRIGRAHRDGLTRAAGSCGEDAACFHNAFRLTDDEIAAAEGSLKELYSSGGAIKRTVDGPLRQSGAYVRYRGESGGDLLAHAWRDAARGIDRLISVYGEGAKPRYPEIDSVAFDVKSPAYRQMLQTVADLLNEKEPSAPLFFQPSLDYSLYLLSLSRRDEAGRLEPMEDNENRAALRHIKEIRWADYAYTVIVVPGAGGDRLAWNLSPPGQMRSEIAARRYHEKKAPLILVSGGYVHPNQTPYAEALEMKKALMTEYGVPESAILIDPHARHTTTNLRNAARILYRYGVPFERRGLIATDRSQSAYIESQVFTKRCDDELGYQPHRLLGRTSPFDLEFLPLIESLQIDATDPLDP